MSRPGRPRGLDAKVVTLVGGVAALGLGAGLVGGVAGLVALVALLQVAVLVYMRRLGRLLAGEVRRTGHELHRDWQRTDERLTAAARDRRAAHADLRRVAKHVRALEVEQRRTATRLGEIEATATRLGGKIDKRVTSHQLQTGLRAQYDQIDALQALYHEIRPERALPPMGHWAASPDLLRFAYEEILRRGPRCIVECGSGVSTVLMAHALERLGGDGRVVALEHKQEYVERTTALLTDHGLCHRVELRHAPLERVQVAGRDYKWYATDRLPPGPVDLLFVDGPPGKEQRHARLPAVPLLYERLADEALVIVDDHDRREEQEMVDWWSEHYPDLRPRVITHQKGTAVLSREPSGS